MVATTVCSAISTAHWEIGKLLHDKKLESKHGSGVVNRLSHDLKQRYPQMGVSPRNLWDMKKFYERFCDSEPKLRQAVAVLPWGHSQGDRRLTIHRRSYLITIGNIIQQALEESHFPALAVFILSFHQGTQ
jgi:hypothetical protein